MKTRSFTLIEIIIVIIIVGVLATLALVNYGSYRENALDKEAKANLRLIQAAEKIYRMENYPIYFPETGSENNITTINSNLKLDLRSLNWSYEAYSSGCGKANRSTRNFYMHITDDDPQDTTACP